MKRLGVLVGVGALSLGGLACTKAGSSDKKLDEIKTEIAQLKKKMDTLVPDSPQQPQAGARGKQGRFGRRALANNTPLGRIERRLARMEQLIARGGGRGAGARRRRPGPDRNTTYSVPVAGAAYKGPKHALVTVVEGFEFA